MIKYLVVEISYHYNDEGYDQESGVIPKKLFQSKKDAEDCADELTYQFVAGATRYDSATKQYIKGCENFSMLHWTWERNLKNNILDKKILSIGGNIESQYDSYYQCIFPPNAKKDDVLDLLRAFHVEFYKVIPVEE